MLLSYEILNDYLSENGGAELIDELFKYFVIKVPERLLLVSEALKRGDLKESRFQLHSIKNSFLNLGALGVAEQCQLTEQKVGIAKIEELLEEVKHLQKSFELVKFELQKFIY